MSNSFGQSIDNSSFGFNGRLSTTTPFGMYLPRKGSRLEAFSPTQELENPLPASALQSLSAMPVYRGKSHEELRFEDYTAGDRGGIVKGGSRPPSSTFGLQAPSLFSFPPQTTSGLQAPSLFSFPPQTTSGLHAPSLFSFPPQTTSGPQAPSLFSFPPQTTSSPQSTPSQFPSRATFPPQTTSNLSPFQTSSILTSSQISPGWFPPQTPPKSSPQPPFGVYSGPVRPSLFSPQTSANPFVPATFNPRPPPAPPSTSPALSDPIAPKTSSTSAAPVISLVFNNYATCTHCSTSPTSISTSNPSASAHVASLSFPLHLAHTVQSTSEGPPSQSIVLELPGMTRLIITQSGSTIPVQNGISTVLSVPNSVTEKTHVPKENHTAPEQPAFAHCCKPKFQPSTDTIPYNFFSLGKPQSSDFPNETRTGMLFSAPVGTSIFSSQSQAPLAGCTPISETAAPSLSSCFSSENKRTKEPVSSTNFTVSAPDFHETKICQDLMDDINALMPKLSIADYYTEPNIKQLAEREMSEPGFCSRVKDFEVGRHGYGNVKFLGETDVRKLCLDSLVEFDDRKIVVYKDEKEKPPVGEGLNKPAEITLVNIKCIDKRTGNEYVDGPEVERYKEMLIKKGEEQGVEFISYDPVEGEWKFRVQHF